MQCRFRDLRRKEVININDGSRLGLVGDVDILVPEGQTAAIVVYGQIPVEVPWKVSASDEIFAYGGGQGSLHDSVYTLISGRAHQTLVTEWERRHQTAMPDHLYNESAGRMMELHFGGVAFFCLSGLPARSEETAEQISQYLYQTLEKLSKIDIDLLLDSRYNKFRKIGVYSEG